ncbi:MFS transporter [soil metagenome]
MPFSDPARPHPAPPSAASQPDVSRRWTAYFSLAWLGFWAANLVPLQLLLPDQLAEIDPGSKVRDFAILNLASAAVALVALPIFGALSDRARNRFGRRRLFIAVGAGLFVVGLLGCAAQTDWVALAAWWSFAQIGLSAMTAGLTAVVADRVPERQRGMASRAIFGPQALGVVLGIGVVSAFALSSGQGYLAISLLLVVLTVPFVRHYQEVPPGDTPPLPLSEVVGSLRIDVRANPDFAWAFAGRLLVNFGNSLGTCYLLYFLTDELQRSDPDTSLLELTVVYLLFGVTLTYLGGLWSDRLGRRRVFVAAAAAMQGVAGLMLAAFPSFGVALVAAALLGGGFGAYMSVDQALVTSVLPDADSRAKDLGIMNIGTIVPVAVAPAVAGLLITSGGGYSSLFAAVGVATSLGAVLVYRIKSVR